MSEPVTTDAVKADIAVFAPMANGGRRRSFRAGCCNVAIEPDDAESDDAAGALAEALLGEYARWEDLRGRYTGAVAEIAALKSRIAKLELLVPPKQPQRLLGPGYVRFAAGAMWLLGKRETGFAAWGVRLDGWDELFRRYDVKVTAQGEDEHGQWWEVQP